MTEESQMREAMKDSGDLPKGKSGLRERKARAGARRDCPFIVQRRPAVLPPNDAMALPIVLLVQHLEHVDHKALQD